MRKLLRGEALLFKSVETSTGQEQVSNLSFIQSLGPTDVDNEINVRWPDGSSQRLRLLDGWTYGLLKNMLFDTSSPEVTEASTQAKRGQKKAKANA